MTFTWLYKVADVILRSVFPEKWSNKDTQGALIAIIAASLLITGVWRVLPWALKFLF